ncbi:amp-dependent synthetase ligase [Lichtheimia corymbifera JMRC:FSU:9682]|uniref:Amp-dependent synthetase ligase n=1 Tax=Lichtheimia corymbifera JMRC:FSU:9682 TaxID=1263082 RepID=A0A068SD59_9FUNG|nr:amp-dependent synthetase ligase [Lichtheimia corymbifera JMRC:FSU:9682]
MVIYKPTIYDWIKLPDQDICSFLFSPSEYNQRLPLDRTAVIDGLTGRSLTYAQVKQRAEHLAAAWQDKVGLKQGDIVAVFAPNQYDTVVLYLSLLGAKCTITPGNPYYTENEFLHQINNSGARALVTVRELLPTLLKVCAKAGTIPKERIFVFGETDSEDGIRSFDSLIKSSTRHVQFPLKDAYRIDPKNDVAFINYSSGTTGLAKGVMLTHHNIISQVFVQLAKDREIDKDTDIGIGFLPLYHIYGVTVLCFNAFYKMLPLVIIPRFELKLFLDLVTRYKITIASIVPPVAVQLAKDPLVLKYDLSVVRHINSGAAPLGKEHVDALMKRMPCAILTNLYGSTESTGGVITQRPSGGHPGSVGILGPNTECMIVDEQGNELGPDKEGEILLRGTSIMKGYLNNPEANAKVFTSDGWMRTGDVGRYDSKTQEFYIVDRLKELIKYNGFPVAPAELESLLSNIPEVIDCAVIGVYSNSQATELPLAFVVVRPGVDANKALEDKIKDYVATHVAGYKRLRGGVRFIDQIPKSPSGKILRRLLRDIIKREDMAAKL